MSGTDVKDILYISEATGTDHMKRDPLAYCKVISKTSTGIDFTDHLPSRKHVLPAILLDIQNV